MKTIEERAAEIFADRFCTRCPKILYTTCDRKLPGCCRIPEVRCMHEVIKNTIAFERVELTRWHNPFLKDMPKGNVLVKYIAVGRPNEPYYTVGRREPSGWWDCENELAISPRFEIVGWQEIHE